MQSKEREAEILMEEYVTALQKQKDELVRVRDEKDREIHAHNQRLIAMEKTLTEAEDKRLEDRVREIQGLLESA